MTFMKEVLDDIWKGNTGISSPRVKFILSFLFYLAFVGLFSYTMIVHTDGLERDIEQPFLWACIVGFFVELGEKVINLFQ